MAQIPYRANLSAAVYPINVSKFGRSVILPGVDQNFDRRVDPAGDSTKNVGIPQAIFMENVLPTAEGYQSLGFFPHDDTMPDVGGAVVNAVLRIPVKNFIDPFFGFFYWLAFYSDGEVRYLVSDSESPAYNATWGTATVPGAGLAPEDDTHVFWAHSQGRTFVLITHDGTDSNLFEVTLVGAVVTFVDVTLGTTGTPLPGTWRSIAGAYNYLILNTYDKVYWSSLTDPLDFTPSLVTGAGFESIGANLTYMNFLLHAAVGFYIFTKSNVVVAQYTGNKAYPWRFVPVENSGVAAYNTDVVSSIEADDIFMRTVRGQLQQIEGRNAVQVIPEVTDYLERSVESDFLDWTTGVMSVYRAQNQTPGNKQFVRVWFVCERYLIISYDNVEGFSFITQYQQAFVYDVMLRRLGKLFKDHTHFFDDGIGFSVVDVSQGPPYTTERVSQDIFESQEGGEGGDDITHVGVILFGNFKTRRNTIVHLEEVTVEAATDLTIPPDVAAFETKVFLTTDDVNYNQVVTPYLASEVASSKKYLLHNSGSSFRVGFKGAFRLSCLAMKFHEQGHEL